MIVGPRYNDVDPAVEAAYERAAEAETASRIDAIAARLEAATPGPWEVVTDNDGRTKEHSVWSEQSSDYVAEWIVTKPDADLIAHAPADLAALLAVVREVAAVLETILDVATDGVMVEDDSTETDLQTAQKRGGALDRIQDLVMNAQDRLEAS